MMHRVFKDIDGWTLPIVGDGPAESADIISWVLDSLPMRTLRSLLNGKGLRVESQPIINKDLSDYLVRLMFPVTGGPIVDGAVVSVVCLFDRRTARTLYAHPMHAGPRVNPLVRHLDGPMAAPKPQADADGDRANQRIIEHKLALWDRFVQERSHLGKQEAGRRWRDGYYWALKRLYFCCGCSQCKWGSPFFDGPDPSLPRKAVVAAHAHPAPSLNLEHTAIVSDILSGEEWRVEVAYAKRGGFAVLEHPRLLKRLANDFVQIVFPTNLSLVQAGALVALSFTYHVPSRSVALSHYLCAGSEPEIQFLKGDVAFGLPRPQPGKAAEDARMTYRSWRRSGWSQFWLDELESGLTFASEVWLREFWVALEALFGGNDISWETEYRPGLADRDMSSVGNSGIKGTRLPPQALENTGGRCFAGHATNPGPISLLKKAHRRYGAGFQPVKTGVAPASSRCEHGLEARSTLFQRAAMQLRAIGLTVLMVNLGRRCNQACHHCHVDAGPDRTEEMSRETVNHVLSALRRFNIETLDITGGAPEMNPHFRYLAGEACRLGCRVVDRCNLTIFFEVGYEDLPEFLAEHGIQVTASLPSDQKEITDRQRGIGSFAKSIAALQKLNGLGYGMPERGLSLNLVFNPSGIDLAAPQDALERRYRRELFNRFGIRFDRLFAMNNMPISRFDHYLRREGHWVDYTNRLVGAFNPDTVDGLMCRRTLSVGYDGRLYDCDFNQMMHVPLSHGLPTHIRDLDAPLLRSRVIHTAAHCFGCTAGAGSSCNGALVTASHEPRASHHGTGRARTTQANGANA